MQFVISYSQPTVTMIHRHHESHTDAKHRDISTVRTAKLGMHSPFPKTRCLEPGSEQQPYRGAGETKAPLELGLWKRTVRERERIQ